MPTPRGASAPSSTHPIVPLVVDEHAAAAALDVSVSWLQKDRRMKKLIPFYRMGGLNKYNLERARAALAALEEGGSSQRSRKRGRS